MKVAGYLLAIWIVLAVAAVAQTEAPKPGPELKKLDAFTGTWSLEANMKGGSMGPGGTVNQKEKCEWQQGGFYMICHSDYTGMMGAGVGLTVYGYSSDEKSYTYHEFNSWGEAGDSKGVIDGDTWTWSSDMKMGGMTMKARYVMKWTSKTSYNFTYDMSQDGSKWSTVMEGKATKM
jgi:hypothetical protein